MNGKQLPDAARGLSQALKVLFASACPECAIVRDGRLDARMFSQSKPSRQRHLACKVLLVIDGVPLPEPVL